MLRRRPTALVGAVVVLVAALLTACTSGGGARSRTQSSPSSASATTSSPTPAATAPIGTGPTTAAAATTCPLASRSFVHDTLGARLGRTTVLRAGGRVVGCRFYAQQHPNAQCDATCLSGERLPGPEQPVAEITTQRYPSSTAAHNAFVRRASASPSVTQVGVGDVTGLCFQNAFYPKDKGQDWACTVNKGATVVLVRTVDTTGTFSTASVLTTVLRSVAA